MARKKLETLTEQMYYVLLALSQDTLHGYGIMQSVSQLTKGRVVIGAGTLYALLARFEEEKLILLTDNKEGRKYYTLTPEGRQTLENEFERLRTLVSDGEQFLKGATQK